MMKLLLVQKLKFSDGKIKKLVEDAMQLTKLEKFSKENPYNLPYSMRKFVTIAAVIAMDVEVIVMDEPTAGQDFKGMKILHDLIDELQKRGKTIVTITHDMEFVVNNFERVIVMTNGKIIADGDKRDIFWELGMNEKILSIEDFVENF